MNNQIKQRTSSNTTGGLWADGPVNDAKLLANDADQVGMQACWYGSDYGDSDYVSQCSQSADVACASLTLLTVQTHTPLPNSGADASFSDEVGMHLWYASNSTTFQQYGWRDGDTEWEYQATWSDYNGHAGVGCYSWGPGTVTYAMFVNLANTVEFWWKDTNTNLTSTDAHPINAWTNASQIAINDVNPASSLGYTNYFYAQMADNMISGYNISWAAENTTILTGTGDQFVVEGDQGLPGTHMSVSAIPNFSGGNQLVVFYQTNGSDISEYARDFYAGQWTSVEIDIPTE